MTIELGKTYLSRNGNPVCIVYENPIGSSKFPFEGDDGIWYDEDGFSKSEMELLTEID